MAAAGVDKTAALGVDKTAALGHVIASAVSGSTEPLSRQMAELNNQLAELKVTMALLNTKVDGLISVVGSAPSSKKTTAKGAATDEKKPTSTATKKATSSIQLFRLAAGGKGVDQTLVKKARDTIKERWDTLPASDKTGSVSKHPVDSDPWFEFASNLVWNGGKGKLALPKEIKDEWSAHVVAYNKENSTSDALTTDV
jgi:hypothetical protein